MARLKPAQSVITNKFGTRRLWAGCTDDEDDCDDGNCNDNMRVRRSGGGVDGGLKGDEHDAQKGTNSSPPEWGNGWSLGLLLAESTGRGKVSAKRLQVRSPHHQS